MELDGRENAKRWRAGRIGGDGPGAPESEGWVLYFSFVSESMCLCTCMMVYVRLCVWPL